MSSWQERMMGQMRTGELVKEVCSFSNPLKPPYHPTCSSQSFAPVESHLPPRHCDKISLERVRWYISTPHHPPPLFTSLSSPFLCFNLPLVVTRRVSLSLLSLSCHHITHTHIFCSCLSCLLIKNIKNLFQTYWNNMNFNLFCFRLNLHPN